MALNDHLEDIALLFKQDGEQKKCWITKKLYTTQPVAVDPNWLKAVITEEGATNAPFYVANLSKLEPPGVSPTPAQKTPPSPAKTTTGIPAPGQGDLVVIPYATPTSAFLVKQSDYQNPDTCPEITPIEGADLTFLAVTQGVVLANIPKEDLTGMSCYLLNLLGLTG